MKERWKPVTDKQAQKKILVAIDLTESNRQVLSKAIEWAERLQANIEVVHVAEIPVSSFGGLSVHPLGGEMQLREEIFAAMESLLADYAIPKQNIHSLLGHPASAICDLAEQGSFDLMILGSHGRHGLRALLGSTANAVLHSAPCDVLLVKIQE